MTYREHIRRTLIEEATPTEAKLYSILDEMGVRYVKQYVIEYPPSFIVVDVYLPDHELIIELDGLHHIMDLEQSAEDAVRDEYIEKIHEIHVVRFMNSAVFDKDIKKSLGRLLSPLRQSRL